MAVKHFEVQTKCGHVGGRNKYIIKSHFVLAESRKEAALKARYFPRVKHDHKDAILSSVEITAEEYAIGNYNNSLDPYFTCTSYQEQCLFLPEDSELILDEPENHLHPEWQVQYAKILVLLQKTYDLTLLVTSHSPDMVSALQRIAEVEHLDGINFYLAEASEENSSMFTYRNLGKNIEPIFNLFNVAIDNIEMYPEK